MLTLEKPDLKYETDFLEYVEEFQTYGDEFHQMSLWGLLKMSREELRRFFPEYLEKLRLFLEQRTVFIEGWVSSSNYFIAVDGKMLGEISLRHRLTPALLDSGGHIGIKLKKSARGQGYGFEALRQLLLVAWGRGLTEVCISCEEGNAASQGLIEKSGGHLHKVGPAEFGGRQFIRREYWIFKDL
jgi:predicted acetyltransferase